MREGGQTSVSTCPHDGQCGLSDCPDTGQKAVSNQVDKRTGTLKHEVHVQREPSKSGEANVRLTNKNETAHVAERTAPPRGGCPPSLRRDEEPMGSQSGWARDWLRSVAEARVALERALALVEVRRERALCVGSAGDGPHSSGGTNVAEANLIALVESEDDLATTHAWATAELKAFDSMAEANRRCLRGAVLNGLDVAEMKYRIGCTDKEISKTFDVSRSKLHHDLAAFVDYLDFIGRERAFNTSSES